MLESLQQMKAMGMINEQQMKEAVKELNKMSDNELQQLEQKAIKEMDKNPQMIDQIKKAKPIKQKKDQPSKKDKNKNQTSSIQHNQVERIPASVMKPLKKYQDYVGNTLARP